MNAITFAFALAVFTGAAAAQQGQNQQSVLIAACNAIEDSAKRLECLNAAMAKPVPQVDRTEAVERAFAAFQSNLEVGISYNNYQVALLELGRELTMFERSAATGDAPGVAKLREALETYKDAGTFWEAAIRFYARRDNGISYGGGLPMNMVGLGWMLSKYNLPTRNSDIWGINVGVPTDLGRSMLWKKAREDAANGLEMLKAPAAKPRGELSS